MKKCSLCGRENADERTYCQHCGGPVKAMHAPSSVGRNRMRVGVTICRSLGVLAIICGLVMFVWPSAAGSDSEGPEPYTHGIRVVIAAILAYAFLRAGSYLDWRSKGIMT